MNNVNPLFKETFVIRPLFSEEEKGIRAVTNRFPKEGTGLLRYAGGKWLPDDGSPDLAFVHGVFAYGVHLPNYTNVIWSWLDSEKSKSWVDKGLEQYVSRWHSQTINDQELIYWDSDLRDIHPNEVAFKSAMDKCCEFHGVANGRGAYLTEEDNEWIRQGQIWIQSTMQPLTKPENPICHLCLNNGYGHRREAFNSRIRYYRENEEDLEKTKIPKLEIDLYDAQDELKRIEECLAEWVNDPLYDEELARID